MTCVIAAPVGELFMPSKSTKSSNRSVEDSRKKYQLSVLLRAQSMHMLGSAFPLDDIAVQPSILPPPVQISPDFSPVSASQTHQQLPFLPDWPEFMAPYCVKPIPLVDILKSGRNIALIGLPGTGKTFALAQMASLIARDHPTVGYLNHPLPVLLHSRDLIEFSRGPNPLQQIVDITAKYTPELSGAAVEDLLVESFQTNNVILMVDGLDELPRSLITECYEIISSIQTSYPGIKMIITGPLDYLDGFLSIGFSPLAMCLWNKPTLFDFIKKINTAYAHRFQPNLDNDELEILQSSSVNWINQSFSPRSPFEYTLQAVSVLTGLESGSTSFDILNTFINQMVPSSSTRSSLEVLAYQTIISENPVINKYEIDHYVPELVQVDTDTTPLAGGNSNARPSKALALVSRKIILQQTLKGNIFFTHPIFLGFLASNALIRNGQCAVIFDLSDWAAKELAMRYLSHMIDTTQYIKFNQLDDDAPLFRKLFSIAHWLGECKQGVIFRPQVMRRLALIINNESNPLSIRAKAMAAIVFANEKNISGLFRQYLTSGSTVVKVLACYSCGILQDQTTFKELTGLLADPDQHVRVAASAAIARWEIPQAQDITASILTQADEYMRRAAAEILTLNPVEGIQTLMDGTTHTDLLVRRACVYGLGLIDKPWSRDQLAKLQLEDDQWVIRNTAAQAVENMNGINAHVPRPLPPAHTAPWLIAFASKNGMGISPTASPVPVLLQALHQGNDDEKIAAMEYLSNFFEEGVIAKLYEVIYSQQLTLREYAIYALWRISLSGVPLPSVKKYGFS